MHQPVTAALLEPAELKGVCAETASSPISPGSAGVQAFLAAYRELYRSEPDAFALAQYDAVRALGGILAGRGGTAQPAQVRDALAAGSFPGLAMTYKSDGKGNMAHSAVIVCYDGVGRIPTVAERYDLGT